MLYNYDWQSELGIWGSRVATSQPDCAQYSDIILSFIIYVFLLSSFMQGGNALLTIYPEGDRFHLGTSLGFL